MSAADENREVIEGFWEDLYNQDLVAATARFAPGGTYTDNETPDDDVAVGSDQIVARLTLAFGKLAGLRDERHHLVAGDDAVMTEHVEHWELHKDVSDFKDEAGIDKNVLPAVKGK